MMAPPNQFHGAANSGSSRRPACSSSSGGCMRTCAVQLDEDLEASCVTSGHAGTGTALRVDEVVRDTSQPRRGRIRRRQRLRSPASHANSTGLNPDGAANKGALTAWLW
jgi:hypothetical protein